jgi:hypothetical protein
MAWKEGFGKMEEEFFPIIVRPIEPLAANHLFTTLSWLDI